MNLFLVHCGFYDPNLVDGTYESHVNFFVIAKDFTDAKTQAKQHPTFIEKRMHIDGLQKIEAVNGYQIKPVEDSTLAGQTLLLNNRKKDLANDDYSQV